MNNHLRNLYKGNDLVLPCEKVFPFFCIPRLSTGNGPILEALRRTFCQHMAEKRVLRNQLLFLDIKLLSHFLFTNLWQPSSLASPSPEQSASKQIASPARGKRWCALIRRKKVLSWLYVFLYTQIHCNAKLLHVHEVFCFPNSFKIAGFHNRNPPCQGFLVL